LTFFIFAARFTVNVPNEIEICWTLFQQEALRKEDLMGIQEEKSAILKADFRVTPSDRLTILVN
jgi:hypothetical protein